MGMLGLLADKAKTNHLFHRLIQNARSLRKDVRFYYYQLAEGIMATLAYARTGIKDWIPIRNTGPRQLTLKLIC